MERCLNQALVHSISLSNLVGEWLVNGLTLEFSTYAMHLIDCYMATIIFLVA